MQATQIHSNTSKHVLAKCQGSPCIRLPFKCFITTARCLDGLLLTENKPNRKKKKEEKRKKRGKKQNPPPTKKALALQLAVGKIKSS